MSLTIWGKSVLARTSTYENVTFGEKGPCVSQKVETAKTRERILKAAGAEFAANGITEARSHE